METLEERLFPGSPLVDAARDIKAFDVPSLRARIYDGLNVNGRGSRGFTLLMFSVAAHNTMMIRELLNAGADPNQKSDDGTSAMMLASGGDDPDSLRILLENKGDPNLLNDREEPILFTAAAQNRPLQIDLLLLFKANINARDAGGLTVLLYCAEMDQYQMVNALLEKGADYRVAALTGWTLAHYVQKSRVMPSSPDGLAKAQTRTFLESKGITFPAPPPVPAASANR